MKIINKHKGFSLLETLLYIGLLSLIIVSISSFYAMIIRERAKNNTISEVEQQGQFIIDNITQSIRNADVISFPAPQATSTSLNLIMQNPLINPTVFSLSGQNITIQEGVGTPINLNGSRVEVSNLTFINMTNVGGPGSVRISLSLRYKNPGSRYEFDYSRTFNTSASLRQ